MLEIVKFDETAAMEEHSITIPFDEYFASRRQISENIYSARNEDESTIFIVISGVTTSKCGVLQDAQRHSTANGRLCEYAKIKE